MFTSLLHTLIGTLLQRVIWSPIKQRLFLLPLPPYATDLIEQLQKLNGTTGCEGGSAASSNHHHNHHSRSASPQGQPASPGTARHRARATARDGSEERRVSDYTKEQLEAVQRSVVAVLATFLPTYKCRRGFPPLEPETKLAGIALGTAMLYCHAEICLGTHFNPMA